MIAYKQWPKCWLWELWAKASEGSENRCGTHVIREANGSLRYRCDCGDTFHRHPGTLNEEAQAWVTEHTPHLKEENNVPQ